MMTDKKKYAFISYNHKDAKWAKWLQNKLESYKLPTEIHNEFEDSKYLRPIFRDKTDLNTGVLSNELKKSLEESKYLIVICSPNSAKSLWVSDEVKAFIEMGRINYIIPFIVAGTPHSYKDKDCEEPYHDECFPLFMRQYTKQHPEMELLGISIDEVGKEKAFIRVVSRMLGLSLDTLWKRHERQKRIRLISTLASAILFVAILISIWFYNQPFDARISYDERVKNNSLPYVDGSITLILENDTLKTTIEDIAISTEFKNIPRKYHNEDVRVLFSAFGYADIDTTLTLKSDNVLPISRVITTYGLIQGIVMNYDDEPVCNAIVSILNQTTESDANGEFSILIPIEEQRPIYEGYIATVCTNQDKVEERVYPEGGNNIINKIYVK